MALDPTKHEDWEIAEEAESRMKTCYQLAEELGITKEELLPHGHHIAKVDYQAVLNRLKDKPDGKFIEVTAVTPTPMGEGKSTTTMGLLQGMGKRKKKVVARPVHPADRVLTGPDRRHQRRDECAQPGHGGPDLAHAARTKLQR
jgi:formate--tetrahydrofolate ligase